MVTLIRRFGPSSYFFNIMAGRRQYSGGGNAKMSSVMKLYLKIFGTTSVN